MIALSIKYENKKIIANYQKKVIRFEVELIVDLISKIRLLFGLKGQAHQIVYEGENSESLILGKLGHHNVKNLFIASAKGRILISPKDSNLNNLTNIFSTRNLLQNTVRLDRNIYKQVEDDKNSIDITISEAKRLGVKLFNNSRNFYNKISIQCPNKLIEEQQSVDTSSSFDSSIYSNKNNKYNELLQMIKEKNIRLIEAYNLSLKLFEQQDIEIFKNYIYNLLVNENICLRAKRLELICEFNNTVLDLNSLLQLIDLVCLSKSKGNSKPELTLNLIGIKYSDIGIPNGYKLDYKLISLTISDKFNHFCNHDTLSTLLTSVSLYNCTELQTVRFRHIKLQTINSFKTLFSFLNKVRCLKVFYLDNIRTEYEPDKDCVISLIANEVIIPNIMVFCNIQKLMIKNTNIFLLHRQSLFNSTIPNIILVNCFSNSTEIDIFDKRNSVIQLLKFNSDINTSAFYNITKITNKIKRLVITNTLISYGSGKNINKGIDSISRYLSSDVLGRLSYLKLSGCIFTVLSCQNLINDLINLEVLVFDQCVIPEPILYLTGNSKLRVLKLYNSLLEMNASSLDRLNLDLSYTEIQCENNNLDFTTVLTRLINNIAAQKVKEFRLYGVTLNLLNKEFIESGKIKRIKNPDSILFAQLLCTSGTANIETNISLLQNVYKNRENNLFIYTDIDTLKQTLKADIIKLLNKDLELSSLFFKNKWDMMCRCHTQEDVNELILLRFLSTCGFGAFTADELIADQFVKYDKTYIDVNKNLDGSFYLNYSEYIMKKENGFKVRLNSVLINDELGCYFPKKFKSNIKNYKYKK
jgi:hypothetical protein